MKELIVNQFIEQKEIFSAFGEKCRGILLELLKDNKIVIHHITSRIKSEQSLEKKIEKKKNKYKNISDITDVCGLRIIAYLESDVDLIAKIIEDEFYLDRENSIDKRELKSDQFGYRSLHYVLSLDEQRLKLSENRKYIGYKLEIQVRSILQHAWAEIEHDLGYKGEFAIPDSFKRRFNRISALLEMADIEFDRLKKDLSNYEFNIQDFIREDPNSVLIDQTSLYSFVLSNKVFEKARQIIHNNTGCEFYNEKEIHHELKKFRLFNIKTIGELETILSGDESHFLSFVNLFSIDMRESRLGITLPLFYYQHFLACKRNSVEFLNDYFNYGITISGERNAQDFLNLYEQSIPEA